MKPIHYILAAGAAALLLAGGSSKAPADEASQKAKIVMAAVTTSIYDRNCAWLPTDFSKQMKESLDELNVPSKAITMAQDAVEGRMKEMGKTTFCATVKPIMESAIKDTKPLIEEKKRLEKLMGK